MMLQRHTAISSADPAQPVGQALDLRLSEEIWAAGGLHFESFQVADCRLDSGSVLDSPGRRAVGPGRSERPGPDGPGRRDRRAVTAAVAVAQPLAVKWPRPPWRRRHLGCPCIMIMPVTMSVRDVIA